MKCAPFVQRRDPGRLRMDYTHRGDGALTIVFMPKMNRRRCQGHHLHGHGAAANLAVLDIGLLTRGPVHQELDRFPAVGAMGCDFADTPGFCFVGQPESTRFMKGRSV